MVGIRRGSRSRRRLHTATSATALGVLSAISVVALDEAPALALGSPPASEWVVKAGGQGSEYVRGIGVDGSGNTFVTGAFDGAPQFGAGPTATVLPGNGPYQAAFVARYLPDGTLDWAIEETAMTSIIAWDGDVDPYGNFHIAGTFAGTATFGSGLSAVQLASVGSSDLFVAVYDADGNLVRVRQDGGAGYETAFAIDVDTAGNEYVTGEFTGTTVLGTGGTTAQLVSDGSTDALVVSYDTDGDLRWARRAGGTDTDAGYDIAVSGVDTGAVTGIFRATADFGSDGLTSGGEADAFVAHFGASGFVQADAIAGASYDAGWGIAIDPSGAAIVAGQFQGDATVGSGASQVVLTAPNDGNVFVARIGLDGTVHYAVSAGQPTYAELAHDVGVDTAGNAYVTGEFTHTTTFGTGASTTSLVSAGETDAFVASYDPSGVLRWARRDGGAGYDVGRVVTVTGIDELGIGGEYRGMFVSDAVRLTPRGGVFDIFVGSLGADAPVRGAVSGTVTGGGNPAPGIVVTLVWERPSWQIIATTFTAADGSYSFPSVVPGTYRIRFFDPNGTLARTWWPSAVTYASGSDIVVDQSATALASAALAPRPGGAVMGVVTDESTGDPIVGAVAQVFDASGLVAAGKTGPTGTYGVGSLPPGTYHVRFLVAGGPYAPEWHDNSPTRTAADPISVGSTAVLLGAALAP